MSITDSHCIQNVSDKYRQTFNLEFSLITNRMKNNIPVNGYR